MERLKDMNLKSYFREHEGIGVLATCDPNATVDVAVYVKPMVINQTTIAFVMRQRLIRIYGISPAQHICLSKKHRILRNTKAFVCI